MKTIYAFLISIALVTTSVYVHAEGDLNLNGMAAFEQLRKEYYIGALYLGWPGHDPAAIASMPGKKRIQINVTADHWPSLRFSQMWNQAITINNPSAFINANALDILAFSSILKGDLVAGDQLTIDLTSNNTTQVSVNGLLALRTHNSALFTMLLNSWIGPRPPTTEFKRDILDLPKDQAGKDLVARFAAIHPSEERKKVIAGWGFKAEKAESEAAVATTATAAATIAAVPKKSEPAAAVKPETATKPAAEARPVAETKPAGETKPATEAKPKSATAAAVATTETGKPVAASPAQRAPQPDAAAIAAHKNQQDELINAYYSIVRKRVLTHIQYPRRAVKENIEGLVMMRIKVDHSGSLISAEVAQSANDILDNEAASAVKKAAPFPKATDALESKNFEFIVPIVFKLTQ